jgi:prepilin-type N-terminal cleavage/methylation domain-containing protein
MINTKRGFSLPEILISLVVLGIIGGGMTKVLLNQNRFFDQQNNLRAARSVARNSMTILLNDLRMAQDSGSIDSVTADGTVMRLLVPYRYGLVCGTTGNVTTVSMLPTDSGTIATSVYIGFAFRNPAGRYTNVYPASPLTTDIPIASASPALCTGSGAGEAQIGTVLVNGRAGDILDLRSAAPSAAPATTPVYLFQRVTYSFKQSGAYSNRLGLWRNVQGGQNEEIMAPFDAGSLFRYYQAGDDTARTTPPPVSDIRGVDIILSAVSPRGTSNVTTSSPSKMVTSVFFKNVRAY